MTSTSRASSPWRRRRFPFHGWSGPRRICTRLASTKRRMVGECQRRTNGRRRTSAAAVNRSERIPHEAELGAFLGAHVSSPAGLPGLACADGVLFEYGDIETSSRLQRDGERYVVIDRDRAREQRAAEFSHLEDAERFLAIRDGRGVRRGNGPRGVQLRRTTWRSPAATERTSSPGSRGARSTSSARSASRGEHRVPAVLGTRFAVRAGLRGGVVTGSVGSAARDATRSVVMAACDRPEPDSRHDRVRLRMNPWMTSTPRASSP